MSFKLFLCEFEVFNHLNDLLRRRYRRVVFFSILLFNGVTVSYVASLSGEEYALVTDQVAWGWGTQAGSMVPSENIVWIHRLSESSDEVGHPGITMHYDLPETGIDYAGLKLDIEVTEAVDSLGFTAYSEVPFDGVCLIFDASGEWHKAKWQIDDSETGQLKTVRLHLTQKEFDGCWGGDKNGEIEYPIQQWLLGASSKMQSRAGTVTFSKFRIFTDQLASFRKVDLIVSASKSSGLFVVGDPNAELFAYVHNRTGDAQDYTLRAHIEYADSAFHVESRRVHLNAYETIKVRVPVSTDLPIYARVNFSLLKNKQVLAESASAYAVVRPRADLPVDFARSFYGISFFEDVAAAQRMGARFIRDLVYWQYVEVVPGHYFLRRQEKLLEEAAIAGLGVILTAVVRTSPDWASFADPSGFLEANNSKYLEDYLKILAAIMKNSSVEGAIEIQNEPDIALMWLQGFDAEKAGHIAGFILDRGYQAIKEVNPKFPVLGAGMSGEDFQHNLKMSKIMFEGRSPPQVDYIASHPYTAKRYTGISGELEWPDSGYLERYWRQAYELADKFSAGKAVWSTELGWAAPPEVDLLGTESRDLAAVLAQAMILSRAAVGVGKFCWFAGQIDWLNEGYDYSMFRKHGGDWYPTLSVNAFATTASLLENARLVEQFIDLEGTQAYCFKTPENGLIVALWSKRGNRELKLTGVDTIEGLRLIDLIGLDESLSRQTTLQLTRAPVFILSQSLSVQEIHDYLRLLLASPSDFSQKRYSLF